MTDSLTPCPTPECLKSLLDGSLPESDQVATQAHVDSCPACQQALELLVAGSKSWDSALDHLRHDSAESHETILSEAIERMKAEEFAESDDRIPFSPGSLDFLTPSDRPGSIGKLGPYEVTEVIGQGGMGIVLKAFEPALHRVVAVKVLAPYLAHNPQARKRFVREAVAIAAVSHDHVITIHAIDESTEQPRIVMQFVAGRSLQQKIDAEGSLELKEILRIGMQTAAGLAAAHAQGLVHRDVKPSNILLENGIQRVKLTDFGLARAVDDASLTQSGAIAGTPQYMAPEQANGDAVDFRADLFSLGSVLYAMCVGHSPFRASTTMGVLKRVCHDPPRPIQELNSDIPDWLCAIVLKLLAKKPEDRFPSAKSVAELLEKWLAHVQQPTVVAKPAFIAEPSASTAGSDPSLTDAERRHREMLRAESRERDARSIFFQPISGRLFLFFMLLGMAGWLIVARNSHVGMAEALLLSVMGGFFTCAWGFLIVALIRFVWANIYGFIPWVTKTTDSGNVANHMVSPSDQKRGLSRVPPESLAMLAAIVSLLLSFNPLIAAIIAIIVWRVTLARREKLAPVVDLSDSAMAPIDVNAASLTAAAPEAARGSDILQQIGGLFRKAASSATGFFGSSAMERNRLLIAIGWCLVGGIDLLVAAVAGFNLFALVVSCFAMSILSFMTSYSIQSLQNLGFVKAMSYLGLLPLSVGALGRIPLSIATLLWQNSPETQASFDPTPLAETHLGRTLHGCGSFVGRTLTTLVWATIWTLAWVSFVTAAFWLFVVPYGPSTYSIYDKARVTLKGQPNAKFVLSAKATGSAAGIAPNIPLYRPQVVSLELADKNAPHRLRLNLGETVVINDFTHQVLSKADIEKCLSDFDGQNHFEHAANLYEVIQRLNSGRVFPAEAESARSIPPSSFTERVRLGIDAWHNQRNERWKPWAGFIRLGSMLDPALFEMIPDHDFSVFECYPATWFSIVGGISAFLIWLVGSSWIIWRRHFQSMPLKPLAAAVITLNP